MSEEDCHLERQMKKWVPDAHSRFFFSFLFFGCGSLTGMSRYAGMCLYQDFMEYWLAFWWR
jgi:hypothetical protein